MTEKLGEAGVNIAKLGIGIAILAVAVPFAAEQFSDLVSGVIDTPQI